MLETLGYQQKIMRLKIDNSITDAFSNSTFRENTNKAWDMRLHWIKYHVTGK